MTSRPMLAVDFLVRASRREATAEGISMTRLKYRRELIAANWIATDETFAWTL